MFKNDCCFKIVTQFTHMLALLGLHFEYTLIEATKETCLEKFKYIILILILKQVLWFWASSPEFKKLVCLKNQFLQILWDVWVKCAFLEK